jgi:hypothetical protein
MSCAVTPPARLNCPPAYNCSPAPSSKTASAYTELFVPLPNAVHVVPFHFAMLFAATPPMLAKSPAA